ncbi:MAG: PAS domain-containing protein [Caulobacterales bacterium]|nr:PAS domain-containing protein [Caulobacterales bacterium]
MRKPSFETDPRLAALVNSIGDIYYVLDRQWRVVMFNDAAETFFDRPRDQLQGYAIWDLYPGFEDSPFAPLLRRAMDAGEPGRLTAASRVRPDRMVEFRVASLGADGVGISLVDVTERVVAEAAMRENRERLDLAVGAHKIGIFDWHVPSGRIVWSPELEALFGLEPGTFEGTAEAFQQRVLAEDLPRAQAETEAAIVAGLDLVSFHFRILRTDGAVRWIEGVARVVYDADGAPLRIVGTNFDVTERVEAQQAVLASRERLDLAVRAHAVGIFDWDLPSGSATWTEEMEDIFGLAHGAFEGRIDDYWRRVVPEDRARMEALAAAELAAGKDVVNYQVRILRSDGAERWVEGAARFILGADGEPVRVVGTALDITDRKFAEQHQRLLINELNHRVKNTLAIVQSIAWRSFRSGGMTLPAREAFEGRLAALAAAHDVLNTENWEGASIGRIVATTVAPHDPGGGRLSVDGPRVTLAPKTAVALGLAVHELLTNAVKHGALSSAAGRVDVSWTVEDGQLRFAWRESGGPPVQGPIERGFGARLLEQGLAEELQGTVRLEFRPEGVVCEVEARLGG